MPLAPSEGMLFYSRLPKDGAGEMDQRVSALAALPEELGLVPSADPPERTWQTAVRCRVEAQN